MRQSPRGGEGRGPHDAASQRCRTCSDSEKVAAKLDGKLRKESPDSPKTRERRNALMQGRPDGTAVLTPERPRLLRGKQTRRQLRRPGLLPGAGLFVWGRRRRARTDRQAWLREAPRTPAPRSSRQPVAVVHPLPMRKLSPRGGCHAVRGHSRDSDPGRSVPEPALRATWANPAARSEPRHRRGADPAAPS